MGFATLSNGVRMPVLGYGVFQIDPRETEGRVREAIAAGYRSIDTAQGYYNEDGVGMAVAKCRVPREEIFLTTKIWISNAGYERAKASIEASLKKLRTDYIDLMLIHQPFGDYYGAYRAMEEAYRAGKLRAIGVSNFDPDRLIDIAGFMEISPMVNQLETHVFQQQRAAQPVLTEYGAQLMAWSPLAQGQNGILQNEVLAGIGERHGKTVAQIALRFLVQSGTVVIPRSVQRKHMEENIDIFDFRLTSREMETIRALDLGKSQFIDHHAAEVAKMFVSAGKIAG